MRLEQAHASRKLPYQSDIDLEHRNNCENDEVAQGSDVSNRPMGIALHIIMLIEMTCIKLVFSQWGPMNV